LTFNNLAYKSLKVIETGAIQKLVCGNYVAVCEIFSVKEWCDLENRVMVRSRSLKWHHLIDRIRVHKCLP